MVCVCGCATSFAHWFMLSPSQWIMTFHYRWYMQKLYHNVCTHDVYTLYVCAYNMRRRPDNKAPLPAYTTTITYTLPHHQQLGWLFAHALKEPTCPPTLFTPYYGAFNERRSNCSAKQPIDLGENSNWLRQLIHDIHGNMVQMCDDRHILVNGHTTRSMQPIAWVQRSSSFPMHRLAIGLLGRAASAPLSDQKNPQQILGC